MPISTLKYTNGEVTVVWKPGICIHSRICWTGLREVFDPTKRPWINMQGGTTEQIIEQVRKCPSGALSYFRNNEDAENETKTTITSEAAEILNIQIRPNGPILISTDCRITHSNGDVEIKKGKTSLCRCGGSARKPYCDGSHKTNGFQG
ncbi:MAG: (4Fe-4S)-binding protein [Bacteroidetes bacterium]|nr:(4Fe-4S)-binding protein [Bacteroidota bacterium]